MLFGPPGTLLGGNLGNFLTSLMVPIEVPIHKYLSEPQNYNPVFFRDDCSIRFLTGDPETVPNWKPRSPSLCPSHTEPSSGEPDVGTRSLGLWWRNLGDFGCGVEGLRFRDQFLWLRASDVEGVLGLMPQGLTWEFPVLIIRILLFRV